MTHEMIHSLWFDGKAHEAADFYKSIFPDFTDISENPLAVNYRMGGRRFMHLNGGPGFPINSSISFFVNLEDEEEIQQVWNKLSEGGQVLMPLNTYPWSPKYGWCADRYGVNWQLMKNHASRTAVLPALMFCQENSGKAEEAIHFYTSLFPNSSIIELSRYEKGEPDVEGNIKYAQFELNQLPFTAMDSSGPHAFTFSEGVSFIVTVDTQEEIDFYWNSLIGTKGSAGKCGWLKDAYGLSWQVVPSCLGKFMSNPATAPKATYAFLQMSKFDIAALEKACLAD
jgi:predicted 3-demethylubiquinone-9 3-methyltransferase (glyoxalase superfamily)